MIGDEGDEDTEATEEVDASGAGAGARVWRLNNKYYSARVQVRTAVGEHLAQRVHAHVLLLQPHEASTYPPRPRSGGRRRPDTPSHMLGAGRG